MCLPGCDEGEATDPGSHVSRVAVKIDPVPAKFNGKITLSDMNPRAGCTLTFDGQGGAAGCGIGTTQVTLTPNDPSCKLGYSVYVQVGGSARGIGKGFFKRFDSEMQRRYPTAEAPADALVVQIKPATGIAPWVWIAGVVPLAVIWWLAR